MAWVLAESVFCLGFFFKNLRLDTSFTNRQDKNSRLSMESRYADHCEVDGQCVSDFSGPER